MSRHQEEEPRRELLVLDQDALPTRGLDDSHELVHLRGLALHKDEPRLADHAQPAHAKAVALGVDQSTMLGAHVVRPEQH
jgi:hypothetical protein